jgi:hypothetical protein
MVSGRMLSGHGRISRFYRFREEDNPSTVSMITPRST